ncbi:MAG: uracil-DNA glycosylase [Pseudomonadota bacterium]|nr:uracil-DNA glycosylase [Pseudomonadota bacterium]
MVSSENNTFAPSQPDSRQEMDQKIPVDAPADDPRHLLEALRWQVDIGADEAIMDTPDPLTASSVVTGKAVIQADQASTTNEMITTTTTPSDHTAELDVSSCQTLEALRHAAEMYDGSELKRTATQIVFADGNPLSDIMFIGEAPGADEDRQGKPFVGVSGQLLNRMLSSIHMPREDVYVTNTILWRPPGNRTPTAQETAQFMPILRRHIQLVAPKLLVCLGGAAAKALLSTDTGILKLRGQWHEFDAGDGLFLPVMPTLHPAYLLRSPQQKALAWKDFRAIAKKMQEIRS